MREEMPDRSKKLFLSIEPTSAIKRDGQLLPDEADVQRMAEIDRIADLLSEDPERWDGLS